MPRTTISIQITESDIAESTCFPNPLVDAQIWRSDGVHVGSCSYACSPENDCIYVFQIAILDEHRRKGYGGATIHELYALYRLPITPAIPLSRDDSQAFWLAMRGRKDGVLVTEGINSRELERLYTKWETPERIAARTEARELALNNTVLLLI